MKSSPAPSRPWRPMFPPEIALREGSPAIVAHLQHGCPSCAAGLRLLAEPAGSTLDRFERDLAAGLRRAASAVEALHAALARLRV